MTDLMQKKKKKNLDFWPCQNKALKTDDYPE